MGIPWEPKRTLLHKQGNEIVSYAVVRVGLKDYFVTRPVIRNQNGERMKGFEARTIQKNDPNIVKVVTHWA